MQLRADLSGGCSLHIALRTHRGATMDKLSSMHEAGWHSHQALQNLWQNEHTEKILMNVIRTCIKWTGLRDLISNHTHTHSFGNSVNNHLCKTKYTASCNRIVTLSVVRKDSTVHYSLNHTDIQ